MNFSIFQTNHKKNLMENAFFAKKRMCILSFVEDQAIMNRIFRHLHSIQVENGWKAMNFRDFSIHLCISCDVQHLPCLNKNVIKFDDKLDCIL